MDRSNTLKILFESKIPGIVAIVALVSVVAAVIVDVVFEDLPIKRSSVDGSKNGE